ncbi:MAG: leucyl/phenylalanyl-tRNA--protein transferase [gamma proteobacterium symbiont of Ctena orbiculata]|uniref:Leucyl/phenylalanyl-tRNA--protein transferase n=1 Tax=Candidatus Thiodiazotropha taylori TaxID=2792791 RepID=A0A944QUC4_9GAMM|nr:leucyl/phenylalanyl-tRNA--protein transferase [Candidatus Thiodiazotropha taylori]MBT3060756.1 leucyl/phenylalanyl-tRNA--protein transferase [Candidatus Thiodiazotropha sp. (ex Lucina pensylvanica)]MBV2096633.1 leucyl/phenylalanyl-tRNA--protein transferase [Candidatus Thiodiazotropha sp. (ex Codakia orbicularis)]PUB71956.1 MAG: leucyl/phenylalanyl-tRNA--protein transferase [gamma proteobacterium symbiont of Ctena orbiculata]MBT3046579.1 leucyl/phenylalanyl-tRNA--protein transferase [Candidat
MIFVLDDNPNTPFPDVSLAEREPDGLLAVGGDLTPQRLIQAYQLGIFPWFTEGEPILWWSPDPRTVLYPEKIKVSRSLKKLLRKKAYKVSFDQDFDAVIRGCAAPRENSPGTWLVPEMIDAYHQQFRLGLAHSVEVWQDDMLVGGLYGMAIGGVFFGESMFSRATDSSKIALVHLSRKLTQWGFKMIDCQVYTQHLASLGAEEIPRAGFCRDLASWTRLEGRPGSWADEGKHYPEMDRC